MTFRFSGSVAELARAKKVVCIMAKMVVLFFSMVWVGSVAAQNYRCVDEDGEFWSTSPCASGQQHPDSAAAGATQTGSSSFAAAPSLKSPDQYRQYSQQICRDEWTTRGDLNQRMYRFCMEQQTEAHKDLLHLHRQHGDQSFYADTAFPHCSDQWTNRGVTNVRMKVHCLNQEVEAVKDLMYLRDKHGAGIVDPIAERGLRRFGSWRMAAYTVERELQ